MGTVIRTLAGTCCQTLNQDKGCTLTLPFFSSRPPFFGYRLKPKDSGLVEKLRPLLKGHFSKNYKLDLHKQLRNRHPTVVLFNQETQGDSPYRWNLKQGAWALVSMHKTVTRLLKSTRLSSQTGGGTDKREDGRTGSTISPDSAGHQPNAHVHTFDNLTGQLVPCSTGPQSTDWNPPMLISYCH